MEDKNETQRFAQILLDMKTRADGSKVSSEHGQTNAAGTTVDPTFGITVPTMKVESMRETFVWRFTLRDGCNMEYHFTCRDEADKYIEKFAMQPFQQTALLRLLWRNDTLISTKVLSVFKRFEITVPSITRSKPTKSPQ
jgi:hypothetical protein